MIRSAIKSGIKKVLGRETPPAPVRASAPPPAWKAPDASDTRGANLAAAEAQKAEDAKALAAKAKLEAEAAQAKAVAEAAPAPVVAAPSVEAAAPVAEAPVTEAPAEAAPEVAARPVVSPTDDTAGPAISFEKVQEIMDEMVRPALQGDGGDITLLRIENNDIYVKLVGSCSTCPSSIMTMKMGVEALLKEEFPAMGSLIQVD